MSKKYNIPQLERDFEQRRVYGDERDFDLFEVEEVDEIPFCQVHIKAIYSHPELEGDSKNKINLSPQCVKNAIKNFIYERLNNSGGILLKRIDINKSPLDSSNSMLVGRGAYIDLMIRRIYTSYESYGEVFSETNEILDIMKQKQSFQKKIKSGRMDYQTALRRLTPLQNKLVKLNNQIITKQIHKCIGKIGKTIEDNEIPQIPLKIHIVPKTKKHNHKVLITSGISALPMQTDHPHFIELLMVLPSAFEIPSDHYHKNYWIIGLMFRMGKYIHLSRQFFSVGHTYGNGNPPKPYTENVNFCGMMFDLPIDLFPYNFCECIIDRFKTIYFLQLLPLYKEEMDFVLVNGFQDLKKKFKADNIPSYVDFNRENVLQEWRELDGIAETMGVWCPNCGTVYRKLEPTQTEIKCKSCGHRFKLKNR